MIGLALGLLIVRHFKDFILAIIIRLLPLRYRISANSATLHARVSTIVSFVLVFLICGTTYWGLGKAVELVTVTEQQTMVNIPPTITLPQTRPASPLTIPIDIEEPVTVPKEVAPPAVVPTVLKTPPPAPQTIPTRPTVVTRPITIVAQPNYYLQVSATQSLERARRGCDRLRQQWNVPCKIGVDETHAYSYKILLGGFATLEDTKAFKRKYRLKNTIPRAKSFYDYIIEE